MLNRLPSSVLLTLSALFWGGDFVVGRWAHTVIGPLSLSFWRWFLSAVILSPFVIPGIWWQRVVIRKNFGILFILALFGMVIFHSFTYIAQNTTGAINAAVVRIGANKAGLFINLIPLFTAIFSIIVGIYLTATAKTKAKSLRAGEI